MQRLVSRRRGEPLVEDPGHNSLYLEFCGEESKLDTHQSLSFGRSADLVVDDNPFMHRVVGRFRNVDGTWRLENRSRRQMIDLRDGSGPGRVTIAPGSAGAILFGEFTCQFTAGPTSYEINGALESFEWESDLLGEYGMESTETVDWGHVELNEDQRLLLVVLCEQYLLGTGSLDAPLITNRQAALRLDWSIAKFNRKLDHLCDKLSRAGVQGLLGRLGGSAFDRRQRLVEHAMTVSLVTVDDLRVLQN